MRIIDVIDRFIAGKKGSARSLISTGDALLDYGWFLMAERKGDVLYVRREPYPSRTSKEHFEEFMFRLANYYHPVDLVDEDLNWAIWEKGPGSQRDVIKRFVREDVVLNITGRKDSDFISVGETVLYRSDRLSKDPFKLFMSGRTEEIVEMAKRSKRARETAEMLRNEWKRLYKLVQPLIEKLKGMKNIDLGDAFVENGTLVIGKRKFVLDRWHSNGPISDIRGLRFLSSLSEREIIMHML